MRSTLLILVLVMGWAIGANADQMPYLDKNFRNCVNSGGGYNPDSGLCVWPDQDGYDQGDNNGYNGGDSGYNNNGYGDDGNAYIEPPPPPVSAQPDWASIASFKTAGQCIFSFNPHSYACTDATFSGLIFPFFPMDWWGSLRGQWMTVTYVNPSSENTGPQFAMAKNTANPRQPMGVVNMDDQSQLGNMWINDDGTMTIENWRGRRLNTTPAEALDGSTIRVYAREGSVRHVFVCRDFNRNDNHHLLCDWAIKNRGPWEHKGYFGFLSQAAWDNFVNTKMAR